MAGYGPHWYATLELASESNFNEQRYMAANPDLRETQKRGGFFTPIGHFRHYGKKEGRMQYVRRNPHRMGDKFRRFLPVLKLDHSQFLAERGTFPITCGTNHLEDEDYYGPNDAPANAHPPEWANLLKANPQGRYLDLGCGFRDVAYDNCLYVEEYLSRIADVIITPGAPLPIRDGALDGLGCFTVLKHARDPSVITAEINRVVKPGGRIFID